MAQQYQLADLLHLMACLRHQPLGCPWDLQQTLDTIVPHTLDEVYEVIDAIDRKDFPHLQDELGDLLFQVVFYARICEEDGHFDFNAVVDGLVKKLLRRHPHVFPDGRFSSFGQGAELTEAEIKASWERIKAEERAEKGDGVSQAAVQPPSALDDIPASLPALLKAQKIQKRAAAQGFDWQSLAPVVDNLQSEVEEFKEALACGEQAAMEDELGDLLFSCVNLARHIQADSEQLLRQSNQKFEQRFREVERLARQQSLVMETATEAELDALWQQAKKRLKAQT